MTENVRIMKKGERKTTLEDVGLTRKPVNRIHKAKAWAPGSASTLIKNVKYTGYVFRRFCCF